MQKWTELAVETQLDYSQGRLPKLIIVVYAIKKMEQYCSCCISVGLHMTMYHWWLVARINKGRTEVRKEEKRKRGVRHKQSGQANN